MEDEEVGVDEDTAPSEDELNEGDEEVIAQEEAAPAHAPVPAPSIPKPALGSVH